MVFFIAAIAFFSVWAVLTNSLGALKQVNVLFLLLACLFFLLSVFAWVFCWAFFVKKQCSLSFFSLFLVGFASLTGSLTPIQSGSDALRSLLLKKHFGLGFSSSIQSSFIVKGLKFSILFFLVFFYFLAFFFGFIFSRAWFSLQDYFTSFFYSVYFLEKDSNLLFFSFFLSGLAVIFLGCVFFLLPLKKSFGAKTAGFFSSLKKVHPVFGRLESFFGGYHGFFEKISFAELFFVLVLLLFSWFFEFLALFFSFLSLGVMVSFGPLLALFVLVSVLERTPFLPRGIGLVEVSSYYFLSFPEFFSGLVLPQSIVGAVLVVYGFARIVFPVFLGFVCYFFLSKLVVRKP